MTERPRVLYAREPTLDVAEFRRVLVESGLGAIRPVEDEPRLQKMLSGASLILTARLDRPDGPLVGVARCVTDFSWCCYLSKLAGRSLEKSPMSRSGSPGPARRRGP